MSFTPWNVLASLVILLASSVSARAQTEITACGQVVTGDAYLSADLDCSGFDGFVLMPERVGHVEPPEVQGIAIGISRKGRLDLRGHTLVASQFGVFCGRSCTIVGNGGTIRSAAVHGVTAEKTLVITDTTLMDNADTALYVRGQIKATGCTISGSDYATWFSNKVSLTSSTVTGNHEFGLSADAITLKDSTVTNNGGFDLIAKRKPHLKNSTCGTSSWGDDHLDVCGAP
jgi:hypothetical protein